MGKLFPEKGKIKKQLIKIAKEFYKITLEKELQHAKKLCGGGTKIVNISHLFW